MKKLLFLSVLYFLAHHCAYGQVTAPLTQWLGNSRTFIEAKGILGSDSALVLPDTISSAPVRSVGIHGNTLYQKTISLGWQPIISGSSVLHLRDSLLHYQIVVDTTQGFQVWTNTQNLNLADTLTIRNGDSTQSGNLSAATYRRFDSAYKVTKNFNLANPHNNYGLVYDSLTGKIIFGLVATGGSGGSSRLDSLHDVNVLARHDGYVLYFDSLSGVWKSKAAQNIDMTGVSIGMFPYWAGSNFAMKNLVQSDVSGLVSALLSKLNVSDSITKYVTPTQLNAAVGAKKLVDLLDVAISSLVDGYVLGYTGSTTNKFQLKPALNSDTSGVTSGQFAYWDATGKVKFKTIASGDLPTYVTSFNGRSGVVVPAANDYTFAQLGSKPTTLSGFGITDGIQNQFSSQQTGAKFWVQYARLDSILQLGTWAIDPAGVTGRIGFNSTLVKYRGHMGGNWESFATESWVNGQFRTGNYIYVDVNNPSSTDTRGTLSKYSLTVPFHTVQAAINSYASGDVIYVRAGTYNETDSITTTKLPSLSDNNIYLILDNATINGGTAPAIYTSINKAITITLNGGTLNNTGNASDTHNAAALYVNTSTLIINGTGGTITSTQSNGVYIAGMTFRPNWSNASITSINSYAVYNSTAAFPQFTNCAMASTTAGALFGVTQMSLNTCTVQSRFACIDLSNQAPSFSIQNSQLTSDSSYVITNTGLGSSGGTNVGYIYSSKLTGYSGIVSFSVGNASFVYTFNFDNCKEITNNGAATAAFSLPSASGSTTQVKTTNTISNIPLYTSSYRTSSEGTKVIVESNTNVSNISAYYNVFVGMGATSPVNAEKARIGGTLVVDSLKTSGSAPATSGSLSMVVTDGNGKLSFQAIPTGGTGGGTVNSVGLTMPSGFSVLGSPITNTGTLAVSTTLSGPLYGTGSGFGSLSLDSHLGFSSPTLSVNNITGFVAAGTGSIGVTGSGTIVSPYTVNGPPIGSASVLGVYKVGSGLAVDGSGVLSVTTGGVGTVTSVGLAAPSWLAVSGSPVTGAGTLTLTAATGQTANQVLATPDGTTGAVAPRALTANDLPSLPESKITSLVTDLGNKVNVTQTINGKALSSNITLNLASADFANQGTSSTVLHGNAAGNPFFGQVALGSEVSGTLPIANGGTAATTANAALNNLLPSQTSNAGKVLQTDGANTSWGTTGIISGGSTGYMPYYTSATSIAPSAMFYYTAGGGSRWGLNTGSPTAVLHTVGTSSLLPLFRASISGTDYARLDGTGDMNLFHLVGGLAAAPSVTIGTRYTGGGTTVTIVGNDVGGTITMNLGPSITSNPDDELVNLTFGTAYGVAPNVVFTPASTWAAKLTSVYVKNISTTGFSIAVATTQAVAGFTYIWMYHVVGNSGN